MRYINPDVSYVFFRNYTEKEIEKITVELHDLYKVKSDISDRLATLNNESSIITSKLLKESQDEFTKANEAYEQALSEYGAKEKVNEAKNEPDNRNEEDTYIKVQASILVDEFLEYIAANMIEIKGKMKTSFMFMNVPSYYSDGKRKVCRAYSGIFGVYDCNTNECIAKTADFEFQQKLFILQRTKYTDELSVVPTSWFNDFYERFIGVFYITLRKKFNYGDTFFLEIEENTIMLTLK